MPQPISNPGQLGGNHGPTLPANLPEDFSSTTNMPAPYSTQCPAMTAAFRHPTSSSVTGLPSAVINRAVGGSDSMAVFGAMSDPRHCRRISRSVSMTGPLMLASAAPGLTGATIGFLPKISRPRDNAGDDFNKGRGFVQLIARPGSPQRRPSWIDRK